MPVSLVDWVEPVVRITPFQNPSDAILGLINVHGTVMPVISMSRKLGFPDRELRLSDCLIIFRLDEYAGALLVDSVGDVREISLAAVSGGIDLASQTRC